MAEPARADWWAGVWLLAAIAVPWAVAVAIWLMLDWPMRLCVVAVALVFVTLLIQQEADR